MKNNEKMPDFQRKRMDLIPHSGTVITSAPDTTDTSHGAQLDDAELSGVCPARDTEQLHSLDPVNHAT